MTSSGMTTHVAPRRNGRRASHTKKMLQAMRDPPHLFGRVTAASSSAGEVEESSGGEQDSYGKRG